MTRELNTATAVPILKVMRLQKPELDIAKAGTLAPSSSLLGSSLCLPDSFGIIHVGEAFSAYLGVLNVSKRFPVTKLTVTAQLQSPTARYDLATKSLDMCNEGGGCELQPGQGIDSIVSHSLDEAGQHILRVEVGYAGTGGALKSLRKFYRFQVLNPLSVQPYVYQKGDTDSSCFVSVSVQNNGQEPKSGLTIASVDFEATPGLAAESISCRSSDDASRTTTTNSYSFPRGVDLFDQSDRLECGDCIQYAFKVSSSEMSAKAPKEAGQLGKFTIEWTKACGEDGHTASNPVMRTGGIANPILDFPVSVKPINGPTELQVGIPFDVEFSVQNHSNEAISAQLQFRVESMVGIAVCGPSSKNLEEIPANGDTTVSFRFLALSPGLAQITGCYLANLSTGQSIPQPPMLNSMVKAS